MCPAFWHKAGQQWNDLTPFTDLFSRLNFYHFKTWLWLQSPVRRDFWQFDTELFLNTTFHKLNIWEKNTSNDQLVPHSNLCRFIFAIVPGTQWSKCKHHISFWQLFSIIFHLWLIDLNLLNTLSKVVEMIHSQTEASDCSQIIYFNLNFIYRSALTWSCSSGQIQVQIHSSIIRIHSLLI